MRSVRRSMCAAMLVLQSVVLFLTGIVSIGALGLGIGTALGIGLGLAGACVVTAGLLGRPGGYPLGWAIQAVSVGLGFFVTTMFFLGVVFAALWTGAYFLGAKIDRERGERAVLEADWQARHGEQGEAGEPGEP